MAEPSVARPLVQALHHVQLAAPPGCEARARAFWCGVLGMTEVAKPPALAIRGGAWFRSGSVELHVGVEEPFEPARKAHPAFVVADLVAARRSLINAGAEVSPDEPIFGYERLHTSDPFGNRLELLGHTP